MKQINEGQVFKNYRKMCEYLEEPVKTGKSKQLQLKDWERYFTYHKDGNSFVVDKVYDKPMEKERKKCEDTSKYDSNNNKYISLMMDYLMMKAETGDGYKTITTWLCDELGLMEKEVCNVPYSDKNTIEAFCKRYTVKNVDLFCDYISSAKSVMKQMFIKALSAMERKGLVEHQDGYMFTYRIGKRSKGHFATDKLNDLINSNETKICNYMNEKRKFSDKLSGRQLLFLIYRAELYTNEFDELKLKALMNNDNEVEVMNACIDEVWSEIGSACGYTYIDETHPLVSYYRGISIDAIENKKCAENVAFKVCNYVRLKTRKMLSNKHYKNRYTGKTVYPYNTFECSIDIAKIERMLFAFYDEDFKDNETSFDMVVFDEEIEKLFKNEEILNISIASDVVA